MSRIGRLPVAVPQGVDIQVAGQKLTVKGKLGAHVLDLHQDVAVTVESGPNRGRIAPDPLRLAPAHVQEPVYWLLRLASPELIPAAR